MASTCTLSRPASAQAAHLQQRFVQHGLLCTEGGKEWQVPTSGTLRVNFIQEPSSDRTLGEVGCCAIPRLVEQVVHLFRLSFGALGESVSACSRLLPECSEYVRQRSITGRRIHDLRFLDGILYIAGRDHPNRIEIFYNVQLPVCTYRDTSHPDAPGRNKLLAFGGTPGWSFAHCSLFLACVRAFVPSTDKHGLWGRGVDRQHSAIANR